MLTATNTCHRATRPVSLLHTPLYTRPAYPQCHFPRRRHADCKHDAATGVSDNGWEIYKMPIKSEYCNAWYEACAADYYCYNSTSGDNSWFTQSALHAQGQCTQASGNCKTYAEVFGALSTRHAAFKRLTCAPPQTRWWLRVGNRAKNYCSELRSTARCWNPARAAKHRADTCTCRTSPVVAFTLQQGEA